MATLHQETSEKSAPPISRFIPLSGNKARDWVKALPLADLGETTRLVFHGLVDLNRKVLPPLERLVITELLRPVVNIVQENLQRHLVARAFPLTQKSQKIFELSQSLLLEFAGAYQLATLDMLTKQEGNKKALQQGIYHALDYLGRALVVTYSVYAETRATIWHDIHHLYLLASEQGLEQLKVREGSPGAPTIEARYIQMNLLALAKPYSLRQGEAVRLVQYFAQNTHLATLAREPQGQVGEYVHAVVLNNDEAAVLMPGRDLPHSPTVRVLNLNPLVAQIDGQIRVQEARDGSALLLQDGLSRNLAKRVVYHLTTMRNRSFNRFPQHETVGMVTRMPDVLGVLREALKPAAEDREEDMLFNVFVSGDYGSEDEVRQAVTQVEDEPGAQIQTWQVVNSSVGGYGLRWEGKEASGARVGEIVALRDLSHDNASWMIGVVKWMEFAADKGLSCGVELLSTKAMELTVDQVTNRTLSQKLPIDGLMLPSIEGARPDPALVLPAYIFRPNDELRVKFMGREERVRLLALDECLGVFAYFRFNTLGEQAVGCDEDDFTALWRSI